MASGVGFDSLCFKDASGTATPAVIHASIKAGAQKARAEGAHPPAYARDRGNVGAGVQGGARRRRGRNRSVDGARVRRRQPAGHRHHVARAARNGLRPGSRHRQGAGGREGIAGMHGQVRAAPRRPPGRAADSLGAHAGRRADRQHADAAQDEDVQQVPTDPRARWATACAAAASEPRSRRCRSSTSSRPSTTASTATGSGSPKATARWCWATSARRRCRRTRRSSPSPPSSSNSNPPPKTRGR